MRGRELHSNEPPGLLYIALKVTKLVDSIHSSTPCTSCVPCLEMQFPFKNMRGLFILWKSYF